MFDKSVPDLKRRHFGRYEVHNLFSDYDSAFVGLKLFRFTVKVADSIRFKVTMGHGRSIGAVSELFFGLYSSSVLILMVFEGIDRGSFGYWVRLQIQLKAALDAPRLDRCDK